MYKFVSLAYLLAIIAGLNPAHALTADGGFTSTPLQNCQTDLRYLNQVSGWQTTWPQQWQALVSGNGENINQDINEWRAVPTALGEAISILRSGIENEEMAPAAVVTRVGQQVDDLSRELGGDGSPYLFSESSGDHAQIWNTFVREELAPSVQGFAKFLNEKYLPASQGVTGLSSITEGKECFANAIKWWTTLDLSIEEIETKGHEWLDHARQELRSTGRPDESIEDIMGRLRNFSQANDTSSSKLIKISKAALDRAKVRLSKISHHAPERRIEIELLPIHMQSSFPAGLFRPGTDEQPAAYIINPSRPNERRLMAEVIAFHEGLPGHYLFFAYPQATASTSFNSGIVEGWAIYAEYLADELGLYGSTLDRQGMITKHLWSASRLVIEPGLHAKGWSRDEAINFMLKNTVMSRTEIEIEIDRYLALPGQSLGYMLGADVFLSERARARAILKGEFDIRDYHHVILKDGIRPLPRVQEDIRAWVAANSTRVEQ